LFETFILQNVSVLRPLFSLIFIPAIAAGADSAPLPTAEQLVSRLADRDAARSRDLESYRATRRYTLVNDRFHKRAEVVVRVHYVSGGAKTFEAVSQDGSALLCDRVLRRVIKAEEDGSHSENRHLSRIDASNYDLSVTGVETLRDRRCYVVSLAPRSKSPFLVRGKAWIDADDCAVVRVEGVLASSLSTTEVPIFGRTELRIEYWDYKVQPDVPAGVALDRKDSSVP
jgi:hypothetical protein